MKRPISIVAWLVGCIAVASACSGENGPARGNAGVDCPGAVAGSRFSVCGGSIGPRTEGAGARLSAAPRAVPFEPAAGASHSITPAEALP